MDRRARRRQALRRRHRHPRQVRGHGRGRPGEARGDAARDDPASSTAQFAEKILADHGVPKLPEGEQPVSELLGWTAATATPQVDVALTPPEGAAHRQRARHAAGRRDRARSTSPAGWSPRCAAPSSRRARTRRPASTSSSRRAPRAAATPARSAASCCGPRSSTRWRRRRCSPPAASAPAGRSPPRWRWARRACGPARSGSPSRRPTRRRRRRDALPRRDQPRHGALALVHRQAVPHAAQRLDRGVGGARHARSRSACRCSSW